MCVRARLPCRRTSARGMSQQDPHEIQQTCESLASGTEQLYALMQAADWLESNSSEKDL